MAPKRWNTSSPSAVDVSIASVSERKPQAFEFVGRLDQMMGQGAPKTVEAPHDQHVPPLKRS
jgi:hypothetical protein